MQGLDTRKQEVLGHIVENYIATAEPVGSKFLVSECGVKASGATVRNDMSRLEELGLLTHPHTSAGRVPTGQGYRYYVDHLMKKGDTTDEQKDALSIPSDIKDLRAQVKGVAKKLAEITRNAVIVAFSTDSVYYTGISYLFGQPEFKDQVRTINVSSIFDHCDEHIDTVYAGIGMSGATVMIGSENPFGNACSLVGVRTKDDTLISILGPMRMDYQNNVSMLDYVSQNF